MREELQDQICQEIMRRFDAIPALEAVIRNLIKEHAPHAASLNRTMMEGIMLDIKKFYPDTEMWVKVRRMFRAIFVLMVYESKPILRWPSVEDLLAMYPEFVGCDKDELNLLLKFRNLLAAALEITTPIAKKLDLIAMVAKLQGNKVYHAGSGQTSGTCRRVLVFERESGRTGSSKKKRTLDHFNDMAKVKAENSLSTIGRFDPNALYNFGQFTAPSGSGSQHMSTLSLPSSVPDPSALTAFAASLKGNATSFGAEKVRTSIVDPRLYEYAVQRQQSALQNGGYFAHVYGQQYPGPTLSVFTSNLPMPSFTHSLPSYPNHTGSQPMGYSDARNNAYGAYGTHPTGSTSSATGVRKSKDIYSSNHPMAAGYTANGFSLSHSNQQPHVTPAVFNPFPSIEGKSATVSITQMEENKRPQATATSTNNSVQAAVSYSTAQAPGRSYVVSTATDGSETDAYLNYGPGSENVISAVDAVVDAEYEKLLQYESESEAESNSSVTVHKVAKKNSPTRGKRRKT